MLRRGSCPVAWGERGGSFHSTGQGLKDRKGGLAKSMHEAGSCGLGGQGAGTQEGQGLWYGLGRRQAGS